MSYTTLDSRPLEKQLYSGKDLESKIRSDLNGRVKNFRLMFSDEGLIFRGQSRSYYDKQVALHVVMTHCNQPIVSNDIEVYDD